MGKVIVMTKQTTAPALTCGEAQQLSKKTGVRIFWRPGGTETWPPSNGDKAEVVE